MSQFDIGNVYSLVSSRSNTKIFYIAISNLVLITYSKDRFSRFTTKRTKGHELEGISVDDLCFYWDIDISVLDSFMVQHFAPDDRAKRDARKRKKENIEIDEGVLITT